MFVATSAMVLAMLIMPAGLRSGHASKDEVPRMARHSEDATADRLDAAYRADDWRTGLRIARAELTVQPKGAKLRGALVRALWRAGQLEDAERVAREIPPGTQEPIELRVLIDIALSRGQLARAIELGRRLETAKTDDALDWYYAFNARFLTSQMDGLPALLRKAEQLTDPANGYPQAYVAESVAGVADFLEAVGPQPLNQIAQYGAAPMPALVLVKLPSCEVMVNGHGPYRMVVDTGGSVMLALDQTVAEEIGLKTLAHGAVRGASGKTESGQALVDDLQIGAIRCRRVLTRVLDVRSAVLNAADGIIGTGIFSGGRMTLDFANGQLIVSRSSATPGPGRASELRLIGDAKLVLPVSLEGQAGLALLDSGADVVAIAPGRLKELFPDRKTQTLAKGVQLGIGSGQAPEITIGSGARVVLAGRDYKNYGGLALDVLDQTLSPVLGVQLDLLVGMPTFRDMRSCTVDFPTARMWVHWLEAE